MPLDLDVAANKLSKTLKVLVGTSKLDDGKVTNFLVHWTRRGKTAKKVMQVVVDAAFGGWLRQKRQDAVTQYAKVLLPADWVCSMVANLGPPKRAFRVLSEYFSTRKEPGKSCFSVFGPEFLQVPRAALGQKGPETRISRFPAPGGLVGQNTKLEESCALLGADRFFPQKCPPSPGKSCFSVFGPEFLSVLRAALGQKGPENPYIAISPPWGSKLAKTQDVKKLRTFWEKLLGPTVSPQKSAPRSGKSRFSVFGPDILSVPRAALGQKGPEPRISRFPAPGRPVGQNTK